MSAWWGGFDLGAGDGPSAKVAAYAHAHVALCHAGALVGFCWVCDELDFVIVVVVGLLPFLGLREKVHLQGFPTFLRVVTVINNLVFFFVLLLHVGG